jgi:hypothetical protein
MKALTLLTAAALTLLSAASGYAQTGAYYGRAKPRRPQLLPKARASWGTGHCAGPFRFGQGLANRKAANSGGLKVCSGEDPSPGDNV